MALLGAINHVSITVSDLSNAMKFFTPLLEFLGYDIEDETRHRNGQRLRVTVNPNNGTAFNIWEAKPQFAGHPFEVYEVGLHHIAFNTDTRDQVDQACELVKQLGAEILDGPGEFPYNPAGGYAVYFLGPDRLKFEIVHEPAVVKRYSEAMRSAGEAKA